jgi:hypothetical protein
VHNIMWSFKEKSLSRKSEDLLRPVQCPTLSQIISVEIACKEQNYSTNRVS